VHQDQVLQLPPEAERLGGNSFCHNALYTIGDQVLGIQGHPEFTPAMMRSYLADADSAFSPSFVAEARQSVSDGQPDNLTVGRWIVNFLSVKPN